MIIGVTGNIGTGKSTVALFLKEALPAALVDADSLGHYIRETNSEVRKLIVQEFGIDVLDEDKRLDRKKLGKYVFADPLRLTRLNQIFYPFMTYEVKMEIMRASRLLNHVILDAALIIEWNMQSQVDHLIVVTANKEVRLKRLMEYRRMPEEDAIERIEAQGEDEFKLQFANTIITNNGTLPELNERLNEFIAKMEVM